LHSGVYPAIPGGLESSPSRTPHGLSLREAPGLVRSFRRERRRGAEQRSGKGRESCPRCRDNFDRPCQAPRVGTAPADKDSVSLRLNSLARSDLAANTPAGKRPLFRKTLKTRENFWWKGRESNPRPRHYECGTEEERPRRVITSA